MHWYWWMSGESHCLWRRQMCKYSRRLWMHLSRWIHVILRRSRMHRHAQRDVFHELQFQQLFSTYVKISNQGGMLLFHGTSMGTGLWKMPCHGNPTIPSSLWQWQSGHDDWPVKWHYTRDWRVPYDAWHVPTWNLYEHDWKLHLRLWTWFHLWRCFPSVYRYQWMQFQWSGSLLWQLKMRQYSRELWMCLSSRLQIGPFWSGLFGCGWVLGKFQSMPVSIFCLSPFLRLFASAIFYLLMKYTGLWCSIDFNNISMQV